MCCSDGGECGDGGDAGTLGAVVVELPLPLPIRFPWPTISPRRGVGSRLRNGPRFVRVTDFLLRDPGAVWNANAASAVDGGASSRSMGAGTLSTAAWLLPLGGFLERVAAGSERNAQRVAVRPSAASPNGFLKERKPWTTMASGFPRWGAALWHALGSLITIYFDAFNVTTAPLRVWKNAEELTAAGAQSLFFSVMRILISILRSKQHRT